MKKITTSSKKENRTVTPRELKKVITRSFDEFALSVGRGLRELQEKVDRGFALASEELKVEVKKLDSRIGGINSRLDDIATRYTPLKSHLDLEKRVTKLERK